MQKRKKISEIKISVVNTIIITIIGSLLTFFLPKIYELLYKPPQIIEISPSEIVQLYRNFENDVLANKIMKELYIGKYVKWKGTIDEVTDGYFNAQIVLVFYLPSNNSLYFNLNVFIVIAEIDKDKSIGLKKGMPVTIVGKISQINKSGINLEKSRLIKE